MAEQEVVKHTKKVIKIWSSDEHSFWHKLKEFFVEIFIIVFAVTLSIWLHDKSEHAHQQKEVKEFLMGLKSDLSDDIKDMNEDQGILQKSKQAFAYLVSLKKTGVINEDSLKFHRFGLLTVVQVISNNGRYEGFKSSGNIGNIENSKLQNDIVSFYQKDIKTLELTTSFYKSRKEKFYDFYTKNIKLDTDSTNNFSTILMTDEGRAHARTLYQVDEVIDRYSFCIKRAKVIIEEIEAEYKE